MKFRVNGIPVPQGSKRAFMNPRRPGVPIIIEDAKRNLKDWRRQIQVAAGMQLGTENKLIDGPVFIWIKFFLLRPKSASKKVIWPTTRPDFDKLTRAVCDALKGTAYRDDSQVITAIVEKVYGDPPGVEVLVQDVPPFSYAKVEWCQREPEPIGMY